MISGLRLRRMRGGRARARGRGRVAGRGAGRGPGPASSKLPAPANHVKDLPNLARMARQYLGVPATSVTVEHLFSVVGFAFADRRKSQRAKTLAMWPTSPSLSSICLLQNFNDSGGAHVNDVWLFVIHPLRFACYATGY